MPKTENECEISYWPVPISGSARVFSRGHKRKSLPKKLILGSVWFMFHALRAKFNDDITAANCVKGHQQVDPVDRSKISEDAAENVHFGQKMWLILIFKIAENQKKGPASVIVREQRICSGVVAQKFIFLMYRDITCTWLNCL